VEPSNSYRDYSQEELAEQTLLGLLLLAPETNADARDVYARVAPQSFGIPAHRLIYTEAQKLAATKGHATVLGVIEGMAFEGTLGAAGSDGYIHHLADKGREGISTITEATGFVLEYGRARKVASLAKETLKAANMTGGMTLDAAEDYARRLLKSLERSDAPKVGETAYDGILLGAEKAFAPAVKTGWWHLDRKVKFSPGRLIVLGARPGIGKTTAATQIAIQILHGRTSGKILYASVEMDAAEIGLKALSCLTAHDSITPFEKKDKEGIDYIIGNAMMVAPTLNRLHVLYGTRMDRLSNLAHEMSKDERDPLLMVIVDFITSMRPVGEFNTKSEAIGSLTKDMKELARDLDIPVLACAQLNRGSKDTSRPSMKDLRDSGEIEQDADVVLLLHNEKDQNGDPSGKTELIIDKNRFGGPGILDLYPDFIHHRFTLPAPSYGG
jgi:replicative DNA helicase